MRINLPIHCFILGAFAGGMLSGCGRSSPEPEKTTIQPIVVQMVEARRGAITRNITLPGEVKAYQQATLYAKVAGYLKTITVDKGDHLKEDELIAEIEVPELIADEEKYKAEVEVAELDYKRLSEARIKAPDLVTPQSVDNAKGKWDVAKANLGRTETLLGFTKIKAPFSGIVTKRLVDPGAFIPAATSGSSAQNAAIVTLSDLNKVRIQVAIPELEASRVATNQSVRVSLSGLPGKHFDGQIARFSYALDDANKTMLAEIELLNPALELRPGMYAAVTIGIERRENALLLPVEAVVVEKAGSFVFVVADGKAKKIPVKVGFNDGVNVEMLDGIKTEQSVILAGGRSLSDGQSVKVGERK